MPSTPTDPAPIPRTKQVLIHLMVGAVSIAASVSVMWPALRSYGVSASAIPWDLAELVLGLVVVIGVFCGYEWRAARTLIVRHTIRRSLMMVAAIAVAVIVLVVWSDIATVARDAGR